MKNNINYPRSPRIPIDGEVLIKRPGKATLKSKFGNISDGGLFVNLQDHDLQKGRRVEVIMVREDGTVLDMQRMSGIVIRIDEEGVALVTYKTDELRRRDNEGNNPIRMTANSSETS